MYSNDLTTAVAVPALLHGHGVPLLCARVNAGAAPQLLAVAVAMGGGYCHTAQQEHAGCQSKDGSAAGPGRQLAGMLIAAQRSVYSSCTVGRQQLSYQGE